jgi:hypothetical protein
MRGEDGEISDVWSGSATLELFDAPTEELAGLAPVEIIGGYYHRVGVTWRQGTTLRRTVPMEVES